MCKRGEYFAWRSGHVDGGKETDWGLVEVIQILGFASEHTNLLASVGAEYTDPDHESLVIEQAMQAARAFKI
jgi:hypothetical protein